MNTFASRLSPLLASATLALVCGQSGAQQPTAQAGAIVYPAQGQNGLQQDRDQYECYAWARGQTGFDPARAASSMPTNTAANGSSKGGSAGAMAGGAMGGAAVAELTHHDVGRGAAIGVLGAAVRNHKKEQQAAQAKQQQMAQQQSAQGAQRNNYERAFGACMQARGYVVR